MGDDEKIVKESHDVDQKHPPTWALRFLRFFCPEDLCEEIEGDLIQKFKRDIKSFGRRRATLKFVWSTARFFRPGILMRNRLSIRNPFYMLEHFAKVFFRTTIKSGGYSFINIIGLSVGLAASIFILLWTWDEVTYDKFNIDRDRIYKVMGHHNFPSGIFTYDDTPGPLAPALIDLPEIEGSARLTYGGQTMVKYEEKSLYKRALYTDASFFDIFTVQIYAGDKTGRKLREGNIFISNKLAGIYFGTEDPLGKIVRIDNFDAQVVGVFKDLGMKSSVQFDLIIPYSSYAKGDQYNNEWGAWTGGQVFVKVLAGADISAITKKIHETFTKPKIWVRWDSNVELFLFPLSDLRLHGNFENGIQQGGRIKYVVGFAIVGVFILVIACINFMNLATSRSLTRAREIGVRKIVGAERRSLIKQFLGESMLISLLASILALMLVHFLLPDFNSWTEKEIRIDYSDPMVYGSIVGLIIITGITAGGYPAFLLSSFKPLNVLSGRFQSLQGNSIRKGLVILQFSLSIILILSALVVFDQIAYMRNKDLGFDRQNVFYLKTSDGLRKNFALFRAQAIQSAYISNVAQSDANPMEIFSAMVLADNAWPGKRKEDNVIFKYLRCDDQLLPLMNFTFVDGRNFSPEFPADSTNYIVNEEAARQMNLKEPVGQYVVAPRKGQIVGLIKDFHSSVLKGPIEPVIISLYPQRSDRIFIRYEQGKLTDAIREVTALYRKYEPDFPLELSFMDETFGRQYQDEIMLGRLSVWFTAIAIFISGLGLFGLASFTAARRSKEIGVRRVMGATVTQMIGLLCRDFMKLIMIALGVALPVSWWLSKQYLRGYTFKVDLGITPFVITSLSVITIAMLTVSYQSLRAASSNPVRVLKTDN